MTRRLGWGAGIALSYAAFAATTTAFVIFAMGRPVALVRPDYYEATLHQDEQAEAERNGRELGAAVSVGLVDTHLTIVLPQADAQGRIALYRPSDAAADRAFALALDAGGRQQVPTGGLVPGHSIVQITWRALGRAYYVERPVVLP